MPIASRLTSTGTLLVNGSFDEVTFNPASGVKKNIISSSNIFDNTGYWQQVASTPIPNSTTAPDGTNTAYLLRESATLNNGHFIQAIPTWQSGNRYTYSIYAKAATKIYLFLLIGSGAIPGQQNATFNLSTGATSGVNTANGTTAAMTNVGNGWWRCSITTPAATSSGTSTIWTSLIDATGTTINYTGDGTSGIYIWGAQVESGSTATIYQDISAAGTLAASKLSTRTTVNSVYASGTFDEVTFNPTSGVKENLFFSTQTLSNTSVWTTSAATMFTANTVAPDNTMTGIFLQETTAGPSGHDLLNSASSVKNLALNTPYTFSVYAKSAQRTAFQMVLQSWTTFDRYYAYNFNLATGTSAFAFSTANSTAVGGSSITSVGNGWYRCSINGITLNSVSDTTVAGILHLANATSVTSYVGDGSSGMYFWGPQLEAGTVATIYEPTGSQGVPSPTAVQKLETNGNLYVIDQFDEWTGAPVVDSNLKMWVDFGQVSSYSGSGSIAYDLSPTRTANVTLTGSPTFNSIDGGGSGVFNGSTQYGTGAGTPLGLSAYTKSFWFKITSYSNGNNIVSSAVGGHFCYFGGSNKLSIGHGFWSNYDAFTSVATFNLNSWYHVCVTFNTATGMALYINGVLDSTYVSTTTNPTNTPVTGSGQVDIANYGASNFLTGSIGQVMIYNRALSADEALTNFNALRNRYGI